MTTMAQTDSMRITVGVDTHKDTHMAAVKDGLGRHLAEQSFSTNLSGYKQLLAWSSSLGEIEAFGIEGTGSFGRGLTQFLLSQGQSVIEVNRPDRSARRSKGKSDPVDAQAAARAVQSGEATAVPKTGDERVEMIRILRVARCSAIKSRTQAMNNLKALVVTAPEELRERLRGLSGAELVETAGRLRPTALTGVLAATKLALRSLARRYQDLNDEVKALEVQLDRLTAEVAPKLLKIFGVGTDVAGALLVAAGGNPERLRSESAFAHLCGAAPIEASSGKTKRHRLNRGGDRQANAALYRIALVRLRHDQATRNYMQKRTQQGKSKREIIRCLKRYIAREVFAVFVEMTSTSLQVTT